MKLPTQVRVSRQMPEPSKLEPITLEPFWKPRGGLWTSSLSESGGQWLDWLRGEGQFRPSESGRLAVRGEVGVWLLEPTEANILVIADPEALAETAERFPYPDRKSFADANLRIYQHLIDWRKVAEEYDAAWIPNPWPYRFGYDLGQDDGGLAYSASMFFYVCDAESTCWFNWCFEGEPRPAAQDQIEAWCYHPYDDEE